MLYLRVLLRVHNLMRAAPTISEQVAGCSNLWPCTTKLLLSSTPCPLVICHRLLPTHRTPAPSPFSYTPASRCAVAQQRTAQHNSAADNAAQQRSGERSEVQVLGFLIVVYVILIPRPSTHTSMYTQVVYVSESILWLIIR
jgi:hypothetical protein